MKTKRFLSIVLTLVMLLGMLPGMSLTASAAGNTMEITPTNTSGNMTITLKIKAAQTITASDVTATYGDTGKRIEATTSGDGALSYAVKSGDAVTVDDSGNLTILKAGAAVVTVTAAETATYAQATKDVNVTVNTKAMTVSAEDVNVTVDGQAHGITVNVTEPAMGYTVKYGTEAGTYDQTTSPTQTEVGEKTVYYQVTADNYTTYTGSAKVTVNAKQTQTTTASDVTATYGDTDKSVIGTTAGDGAISYSVKSGDAVTVDENTGALTIVKAGSAVITVTAAETATYAQATKDVNVTVYTKAMTVSAENVNVTVDGQPHGITVNVTDPATGYTVKYGTEEGSYTLDASPTQTEVGEKTVYYQVTAANYTTYTGSAKVTVSAKQSQTITAADVTVAYGDTDKKVTATTNGNGAITYAVKDGSADYIAVDAATGALTIKKVGTATVIVTAAETATYAQATKEVTVTINKANAIAATVTANNRTYDGMAQPLVTVTGEPTGGTMQYALGTATEATEQYTTSIPTATNAGTYYVWCKAVGDTNHLDSTAACVTVTVSSLTIAPADVPTSEVVEVDGVKYPVDPVTGAIQIPDSSSARIIETFGYSNGGDAHTTYPTSLKVWVVTEDANGVRTAVRVPELDDIMRYSGFSIRVTGNRGIRMITSVPTDKKNALIAAAGLAGFTLEEYGTVVGWADALNGGSLTMSNALGHAYAYKRGAGDAVVKTSGGSTQYTNVLVKFTDEQVSKDLIMRSYMVLSKGGVRYTLYGGSVQRSIGYVAYQNRAAFRPGTAPYEYVWSLIHIAYGNRYDGEYQH